MNVNYDLCSVGLLFIDSYCFIFFLFKYIYLFQFVLNFAVQTADRLHVWIDNKVGFNLFIIGLGFSFFICIKFFMNWAYGMCSVYVFHCFIILIIIIVKCWPLCIIFLIWYVLFCLDCIHVHIDTKVRFNFSSWCWDSFFSFARKISGSGILFFIFIFHYFVILIAPIFTVKCWLRWKNPSFF